MDEAHIDRRTALMTLSLGALAGCGAHGSQAGSTVPETQARQSSPSPSPQSAPTPQLTLAPALAKDPAMVIPALRGDHTVVPLPFDPAKLNGLSERMLRSHHENNYAGAVKNLNRTEQELSSVNKDTPPFMVAALRERELTFRGSKLLHELYFGNLGGDGLRAGSIEQALGQAYGSSGRWEEQFRLTGLGLGGGSGWVMLGYELDSGALRTFWSGSHTQALALSAPLLVMDMYEHSYQMDFGAAVAKYIDAFFANVSWESVERRFAAAQRARQAWLG